MICDTPDPKIIKWRIKDLWYAVPPCQLPVIKRSTSLGVLQIFSGWIGNCCDDDSGHPSGVVICVHIVPAPHKLVSRDAT